MQQYVSSQISNNAQHYRITTIKTITMAAANEANIGLHTRRAMGHLSGKEMLHQNNAVSHSYKQVHYNALHSLIKDASNVMDILYTDNFSSHNVQSAVYANQISPMHWHTRTQEDTFSLYVKKINKTS